MNRKASGHVGLITALAIVAVGAAGFLVWRSLEEQSKPPPSFPLLTDDPDPALRGTVAWVDTTDNCVKAISASGSARRELYCIEGGDITGGVVLAWLPDGRLEMTLYEWPMPASIRAVWRKVVDVGTLTIEDASIEGVPNTPPAPAQPAPTPEGAEVVVTADGGRLTIALDDEVGSRVLFDGEGAPDYGTEPFPPIWSPDWEWILVNDGRLIVVTVDDPPVARILVEDTSSWTSARIPGVAVTGEDLLGSS